MNKAEGIVTETSGESVRVEVDAGICPRCRDGQGCGAGVFTGSRRTLAISVPVDGGLRVKTGDSVQLALPAGRLLRGVLVLYGLPLTGLLLGSGAASLAGSAEPAAVACGLGGLVAGFAAARWLARRDPCLSDLKPVVSGVAASRPGREAGDGL